MTIYTQDQKPKRKYTFNRTEKVEAYLARAKPPKPTAESSAKSAATRKGMKLTAEHRLNMSIAQQKRADSPDWKYSMPYKGRFRPNNPHKYDGDSTNIVYRSGLELRFMQHLDSSAGVIKWQSEEFFIPYRDASRDNTWHRYFPDFLVVVKQGSGTLTQLIEVKPAKQCAPPTGTPHRDGRKNRRLLTEQLTYIQNQCKWQAATEYCADRGWKFKIVTDKDILGLK